MTPQTTAASTPSPVVGENLIPPTRTPRQAWYLATNQLNLMYLLAAGLITGPRGFGQKYYRDSLGALPGLIPLFAGRVPAAALATAVAEGPPLRAVLAPVDLSALRGPVLALRPDGALQDCPFPDGLTGDEAALLVPAPLPAHWITTVLFASAADRDATRDEAAGYANVPLAGVKQQVKPRLFNGDALLPWPPTPLEVAGSDPSPRQVAAVGAALALLHGLGNAGPNTAAAGQALWALPEAGPDDADDPTIRVLLRWALAAPDNDADGAQSQLLQRLLSALVAAADSADPCPPDPRQVVLDTLADEATRLDEPKWREALTRLAADLRGSVELGDATVLELMQRHQRPFSRGLLLFFLRERCEDLLSFRHPALTDQDLVVAGALFAARWGWMALPPSLRTVAGLAPAVQHRMAKLAHRQQGTGLDLGAAPPSVLPLRTLLETARPKARDAAALLLTRGMGWADELISTRISLGKGEYRLSVDGRGAHLLLAGDVKAVASEVDQAALLARLAAAAVPKRLDAQLRELLSSRDKMTGSPIPAHQRPTA
ncbi:MAG: hypothetical protein EA400_07580 [Chromatiaceae bacterium]|nr:MAG: hypothetical protein EA400_07580 [Chromatiaceae bacterium]